MGKNNQELADLEARIREMEERLRRSQPGRPATQPGSIPASSQKRPDVTYAPSLAKEDGKSRSRPGTARATQKAPGSGHMPPTPGASEGE